jgi:NADH:ubiquinone oxidoreductase subunit K
VIPLSHYLIVSATLFCLGVAGVFMRRNLITILLSIEIMLNAVNLSFVAFGRFNGDDTPVREFKNQILGLRHRGPPAPPRRWRSRGPPSRREARAHR